MAEARREQRPELKDSKGSVSNIGLNNPEYVYREVGKDKHANEYGRIGKHKDKGYVMVKDGALREYFLSLIAAKRRSEIVQLEELRKTTQNALNVVTDNILTPITLASPPKDGWILFPLLFHGKLNVFLPVSFCKLICCIVEELL